MAFTGCTLSAHNQVESDHWLGKTEGWMSTIWFAVQLLQTVVSHSISLSLQSPMSCLTEHYNWFTIKTQLLAANNHDFVPTEQLCLLSQGGLFFHIFHYYHHMAWPWIYYDTHKGLLRKCMVATPDCCSSVTHHTRVAHSFSSSQCTTVHREHYMLISWYGWSYLLWSHFRGPCFAADLVMGPLRAFSLVIWLPLFEVEEFILERGVSVILKQYMFR